MRDGLGKGFHKSKLKYGTTIIISTRAIHVFIYQVVTTTNIIYQNFFHVAAHTHINGTSY